MQTVIEVLDKYGLELKLPKTKSELRKIKYGTLNKAEVEAKELAELYHYKIEIKIKDIVRATDMFGFPIEVITLPNVCFDDLRILVMSLNDKRRKRYPVYARFAPTKSLQGTTKDVMKQIKKSPEAYGFNRNELKLKEAFGSTKEIEEKAQRISLRYHWQTDSVLKRMDLTQFEKELQDAVNRFGIPINELLKENGYE